MVTVLCKHSTIIEIIKNCSAVYSHSVAYEFIGIEEIACAWPRPPMNAPHRTFSHLHGATIFWTMPRHILERIKYAAHSVGSDWFCVDLGVLFHSYFRLVERTIINSNLQDMTLQGISSGTVTAKDNQHNRPIFIRPKQNHLICMHTWKAYRFWA